MYNTEVLPQFKSPPPPSMKYYYNWH